MTVAAAPAIAAMTIGSEGASFICLLCSVMSTALYVGFDGTRTGDGPPAGLELKILMGGDIVSLLEGSSEDMNDGFREGVAVGTIEGN